MAVIEVTKCDRCKKFADGDQPVVVTITLGAGGPHESPKGFDLCDPCVAELAFFLEGRRLARTRKAAE